MPVCVCSRGHTHIESSHSLCQIWCKWMAGSKIGLMIYRFFVKILFDFKEKILTWIKANLLKTLLLLPKTKNLNIYITPLWKFNLSKTRMEKSMKSNFFQKFKEKFKIFAHILDILLKRFLRKSTKPGHENLVLITSTIQVKLSRLKFNYDGYKS